MRVQARAANRRHDQVARFELRDAGADFNDFAQRFVAEHEIIKTVRWRAVNKRANLAVGAADPHFEGSDLHLAWLGDFRRLMFHQPHLALAGDDSDGSHQ